MGELESIFVILAALYLSECLFWVPRDAVIFARWLKPWRSHSPGTLLGNQRGGVFLAAPLPPLGNLFISQPCPLSLAPDGVFAWTATSLNPDGRAAQTGRFLRWDELSKVSVEKKQVHVNDQLLVSATSPAHARQLAKWLRDIQALPANQRENAVQKHQRASLDSMRVKHRLASWQARHQAMRWLGNSLFVLLFIGAPLLLWQIGLKRSWGALLFALLAHTISLGVLFQRAHRELFPEGSEERFTPLCTMLLAPSAAIRATDYLTRDLLAEFHPLVVAHALCAPEDFKKFARMVLLDLHFPLLPLCPTQATAAVEVEQWSRAAWLAEVEKFLREHEISPEEILAAPAREEACHRSYCPRCRAQFIVLDGSCADCGGRTLIPLLTESRAAESKVGGKKI